MYACGQWSVVVVVFIFFLLCLFNVIRKCLNVLCATIVSGDSSRISIYNIYTIMRRCEIQVVNRSKCAGIIPNSDACVCVWSTNFALLVRVVREWCEMAQIATQGRRVVRSNMKMQRDKRKYEYTYTQLPQQWGARYRPDGGDHDDACDADDDDEHSRQGHKHAPR